MLSRSQSTRETTEADSPQLDTPRRLTLKDDLSNMIAAMRAQALSNTTSVPEANAGGSPRADPLPMAPAVGGMRPYRGAAVHVGPSSPAVQVSASASKGETAAQAGHVSSREKFRMQVKAVTKAAEAASPESRETFFVGHFIFLPVNGKRVRFHKTFLRDACRSFPLHHHISS